MAPEARKPVHDNVQSDRDMLAWIAQDVLNRLRDLVSAFGRLADAHKDLAACFFVARRRVESARAMGAAEAYEECAEGLLAIIEAYNPGNQEGLNHG